MRKHLIRAFIAALAVACFGITTATSQKPQPYLQVEDLPDILTFLPPPPAEDSPVFQADKAIHDWALTQGSGERAQRAIREGTTDVDTMALYFSGAFGKKLSKETTPLTMYLFER
ncbi:MAG: hypothetical protein IJR56_07750, partial [Bacteroidaceae bacterium]|nr:hypothetical protein [Bacteroidaceae bacterium]